MLGRSLSCRHTSTSVSSPRRRHLGEYPGEEIEISAGSSRRIPRRISANSLTPGVHVAQRAALIVRAHRKRHPESAKAFIEESIVRDLGDISAM